MRFFFLNVCFHSRKKKKKKGNKTLQLLNQFSKQTQQERETKAYSAALLKGAVITQTKRHSECMAPRNRTQCRDILLCCLASATDTHHRKRHACSKIQVTRALRRWKYQNCQKNSAQFSPVTWRLAWNPDVPRHPFSYTLHTEALTAHQVKALVIELEIFLSSLINALVSSFVVSLYAVGHVQSYQTISVF